MHFAPPNMQHGRARLESFFSYMKALGYETLRMFEEKVADGPKFKELEESTQRGLMTQNTFVKFHGLMLSYS